MNASSRKSMFLFLSIIILVTTVFSGVSIQNSPRILKADDYMHAEKFLAAHTAGLVFGDRVDPTWIDADRFWYRSNTPDGTEFIFVDAGKRIRKPAFDHAKLAAALSEATDRNIDPFALPFSRFSFTPDGESIILEMEDRLFTYHMTSARLISETALETPDPWIVPSPDNKRAVFVREYNLWVREIVTGVETQLTTDGIRDFGYATNNAGWTRNDRPVVLWSPDSRKVATFQHDGRGVGEMYLVSTNVGHPTLHSWKYPLPEDKEIFRIHRVVIHVDEPHVVRLKMPPDQHRSTVCDHIVCRGSGFTDIEWSPDSSRLFFVSSSRDHKQAILREADPQTGTVRDILEETVDTFFESGYNMANWHALPESNEALWFSQKDDWGHIYLHDLTTGKLKNRVTQGKWNVLQVLRIDHKNRTITFLGAGREPGDPYFQYLYRIGLDGSGLKLLTPENANHTIFLPRTGNYFVDSYSTPDTPPVTVLRDLRGRKPFVLEKADIHRLVESGWIPPIPFSVKARDGKTDLYGLMHKPTHFDESKKYPIINYIYPGPQSGSVGSRSFAASRGDRQSLAELGFIVVAIDAMGTPMRSKSFHAAYYGDMGDNGLPDQISGMKQLAERYPWIDLDRVGIYGHSGGGFASTDAILRYPDFFKVAVSGAGNHDNRNYEDDWGEKWQGLLKTNPDGSTNYDNQANQLLAQNLKGRLLIAHGTLDSNVPMYNTLLVVNELIAANKDFDLILFPNRGHGFGNEPYMMRRRWDYFVKHLMGAVPPKEYAFTVDTARRRR